MNDKIKHFCSHFERFSDCYVLIGGSACALLYENEDPPFRPTRDVDVVLFAKTLSSDFEESLNRYLAENKYKYYSIHSEEKLSFRMYRFTTDRDSSAPEQIELLSCKGELKLAPEQHIGPLKAGDAYTRFSCILMDDEYFDFLRRNTRHLQGIPVPSRLALVVLKIKAYLNIRQMRRAKAGETRPRSDEMNKHRNDACLLLLDADPEDDKEVEGLTPAIIADLHLFEEALQEPHLWESVRQSMISHKKGAADMIKSITVQDMLDTIDRFFRLQHKEAGSGDPS